MSAPFVVAHVSDFHVSAFGDTLHDRKNLVKRSTRVADTSPARFEVAWEERGWRVLRERVGRHRLQLVDPEGYAHPLPAREGREPEGDPGSARDDGVSRVVAKARRLDARRAKVLVVEPPRDSALARLLDETPTNANARLLRAARHVETAAPDVVVATGDLTDDGEGYELVESAFAPWVARGRFLAVPGNHDLYLFPIAASARPRATQERKRAAFQAFAKNVGLEVGPSGAWSRFFPEAGGVLFVGLDTCARPQRRFFRHNGAVGPAQIQHLKELAASEAWRNARHRVVALHHHVVPLPHGVGKRAPLEIGMRLDDAREVAAVLHEAGATMVLHGHRHISEARYPAGLAFHLLAAPSLTLGCKSGDGPSFWRIELGERAHVTRVHVPFGAVEQDNDPIAAVPPDVTPSAPDVEQA